MSSDYDYSFEWDAKYCYPQSNVLKNKLGIRDAAALQTAEREITSFKMAAGLLHGIPGNFDFQHLRDIHKFLFEDIYEWAGEIRQVDISKGNVFCQSNFIHDQANNVFRQLENEGFLRKTSDTDIPSRLSYYLSEINVIHPFREGNGRAQRLFIQLLAQSLGYSLDFSKITPQEMIEASADSFHCRYEKMDSIFSRAIEPLDRHRQVRSAKDLLDDRFRE